MGQINTYQRPKDLQNICGKNSKKVTKISKYVYQKYKFEKLYLTRYLAQ